MFDDLEFEASDESVQIRWSQRRSPLRTVFTLRTPGGLCIQGQDRSSLGTQCVSYLSLVTCTQTNH